jgi:hypothetical protein
MKEKKKIASEIPALAIQIFGLQERIKQQQEAVTKIAKQAEAITAIAEPALKIARDLQIVDHQFNIFANQSPVLNTASFKEYTTHY